MTQNVNRPTIRSFCGDFFKKRLPGGFAQPYVAGSAQPHVAGSAQPHVAGSAQPHVAGSAQPRVAGPEAVGYDFVQLAVLLLFSPLFLFPRGNIVWAFLIIPLLWIGRKLVHGRFWQPTLLDIPLFVLLVRLFLDTMLTNPAHGYSKSSGFLFAVAMYYAVAALAKTGKTIKIGVLIYLCAGVFFALFGLAGMFTFRVKHLTLLMKLKEMLPTVNFKLPGAEKGFHPNAVAGTLILVIPLLTILFFSYIMRRQREQGEFAAGGRVLRILLFTGLAITLGVLLLTQSRGAFGGMVLAGGLVFFLCLKKKKRKIIIIIVAVALSALLVSTYLSPPGKAGEAAGGVESPVKPGVMSQMKLTAKQAEGTLFFRVIMWNKAMPLIYSNPLMGLGMNEFRYRPDVKYSYSHPHNKLFLLAVEMGIPALVAYLAMLICMGYMVYFVWTRKRKEQPWQAAAILGLGIGQLAHFLFEMTDAIPFGAKVDGLSWISLALIAAIYNYTSQDHEERTKEKTKDKPKDKMKANA